MNSNKLLIQWEKDAVAVANYYKDKIKEHGLTSKSLGEREKIKDKIFFDGLFEGLELDNELSILDIGSGMGDVIPYLENNKNVRIIDYLGIDLIEKYVNYCKIKYQNREFVGVNFISEKFQSVKEYDLVIAMGVLVSRVSDYNDYLEFFIQKALKYTKKFFVFNIITEIDQSSSNYEHQQKIGGITYIPENQLINILDKLNIDNRFTYDINKKKIFEDATDAFVQIILSL